MTRRWRFSVPIQVGIAVGRDRVVAVAPGDPATTPWERPLTPPGDSDASWPGLAAALGELRVALLARRGGARSSDAFRGELHVALLPPLGDLRRIELAGLNLSEARQVLRREPSRYLARSADSAPLELDVEGDGWRRSSPFTLFAASRAIVDGVHAAARESGWRLGRIVAAEDAWAASASSLLPGRDVAERALVLCLDDRVEVVRARGGRTTAVRRFPLGVQGLASLVQLLHPGAPGSPRPHLAIVGESPNAEALRLTLAGGTDGGRAGAPTAWRASPALLAARFVTRAKGPALLPESERAARAHSARRANVIRYLAAFALLVGAAVLQLWGLSREHDAIVADRARLRGPVTQALAVRDSVGGLSGRLTTIRSAATAAPRWSALLVALSSRLPDDAYLVSLSADGDSLHLEGFATRAEGVFAALRGMQGISTLRPDGPIRQEIADDGSTSERFTLSARVEGQR